MQMIAEAGAGQITVTIIMMPGEIFNLKQASLAGNLFRRLAHARPHQ